jgi:hypothetical protein
VIGYRVIESEENEEVVYPKGTETRMALNQLSSSNDLSSQSNHASLSEKQQFEENQTESFAERKENGEKSLNMTESIKCLLNRYENIKNNSKFKH